MTLMIPGDIPTAPDGTLYETTRGLYPVCRRVVAAEVIIRDDAVYLVKHCPEHGDHEAFVPSHAGWFRDARRYDKPKAAPSNTHGKSPTAAPTTAASVRITGNTPAPP